MTLPHKEEIVFLFEGSLRAIPFNTILAILLTLELLYMHVPWQHVIWIAPVILFSACRWFFCRYFLKKGLGQYKSSLSLIYFILLTFITGTAWGIFYCLIFPYISVIQEFIIILVLGGLSVGAIASLSIYLPAYYAYIIPIFIQVTAYNYWIDKGERIVLASMFLFFLIMIIISARMNHSSLKKVFLLFREKERLIDDLQMLSITDALTGLYNRRYFQSILQKEWDKAQRNHYSIILVSIDIDNFKLINDNLGHTYGDNFLIYTAKLLKKIFRRANDTIYRVGGDEFFVILINQTIQECLTVCHSFNEQFNNKKSKKKSIMKLITLSMGIVSTQGNYKFQIDNLIALADKALYQAKNEGKNSMVIKELTVPVKVRSIHLGH
ncbi:GGDEF domain-containing protein [Legionella bozemanae]|uniref:diguanylate cyclase n=1 Tax=Legionella bozemanae TaxID=447 RepID=A0A0W0RJR1_LEGBO|nr:GGDEF domain-containing protein [Legionella bozemanae]KTC71263.1 two component response regulator with GGDEF domain protein [Legionella bozemanae]STO33399.1 Probable diguanylate cyclase AdrA [Legionella bozemanae]